MNINNGHLLGLIADPEMEDLAAGIPAPPFAVRSEAHLVELLLEGAASPKQEICGQEWIDLRHEVRERLAQPK